MKKAIKQETKHEYEIKNLQTFRTPDGGGYNCSLWRDGKKVADCHEGGHGGEVDIHFNVKTNGHMLQGPEWDILVAHCKTLPKWSIDDIKHDEKYEMTPDILIGELVAEFEKNKHEKAFTRKMAKACKTNIVFRLTGDEEGSYREIKIDPTQESLERCVKHFKDKGKKELVHCYNTGLKLGGGK